MALVLISGCALAACDRHDATEVPESYGHGSARQKSYTDHHVDSSGKEHYSDTQGTESDTAEATKPSGKASPSPAGTPGGHFF